jgi:hypothetical protein
MLLLTVWGCKNCVGLFKVERNADARSLFTEW